MGTPAQNRLPIGALLLGGVQMLGRGLPLFLSLTVATALLLAALSGIVLLINWGPAGEQTLDPQTLLFGLTAPQFLVFGLGFAAAAVVLSYAAAATVQAVGELAAGGSIGFWECLRRVRVKTLQLFWLQALINLLAARYSAPAALFAWLFVAPAFPAGVLENLGPGDALDRTWSLSRGNRIRLLLIEFLLTLVCLLIPLAVLLTRPGNIQLPDISALGRLALTLPAWFVLLLPGQLLFIVLTLAYRHLALHATAPAGVKS